MQAQRGASWCFLLSVIGIGLAGYLAFLHLGLMRGELLGGAVCSGAGPLNCHAVTAGSWGSLLGMPLAFWGMLGYLAIAALALVAWQSPEWAERMLPLIFTLSLLFVAADVALFCVMALVIRFYCLFCLFTYAVNLLLLVASAYALPKPWPQTLGQVGSSLGALIPSPQRPVTALFWGVLLVGALGVVGAHTATRFVSQGAFGSLRKQLREFISKQPRVSISIVGDPSIGPSNASVQIIEFSDLLCPACQRASQLNKIILANHRRDLLFVFKHFPLDPTCNDKVQRMVHPGACQVAAASECAHLQGRFWPYHDLVFEAGHMYNIATIDADITRLGLDLPRFRACMDSGEGLTAVKSDIAEAGKIGVLSTPTYVINGLPVAGGLNPSMFDDFVAVLKEQSH